MSWFARAIFLAVLATPLAAQDLPASVSTPMSAVEFDAYVTGKTLDWAFEDQPWGVEEYLPNRRVQWATEPGECQIGRWEVEGNQICFSYEGRYVISCLIFRRTANGLTADLQGPNAPLALSETAQSTQGLACPGPDLGV
jgi:hypothetical protein